MLLVLLASTRPEWFVFSSGSQKQVEKQTTTPKPRQATITRHKTTAPKTQPKAHIAAPKHTAPPKTTAPATKKASVTIANGYYIQLGAFHERPRAQGLADQMKHKGMHTIIAPRAGDLHAVWIGPAKTHAEAKALLKRLQPGLKNKGFIVHQP